MIIFIYRDDYYHKDSPDKGLAEIIVGKQRDGSRDTVMARYQGEFLLFEARGDWQPEERHHAPEAQKPRTFRRIGKDRAGGE